MIKLKDKYPAFTLIEMLLVMSIFIILFGITISAFSGLRSTVIMNQSAENFKQNVRWTQRAAIFLKRDPEEAWIYGIGLDLRGFTEAPDYNTYKIFKWCSPGKGYYDDPRAQGPLPNLLETDTSLDSPPGAGSIPTGLSDIRVDGKCSPVGNEGIAFIASEEAGTKGSGIIDEFTIPEPLDVGIYSEVAATIDFPAFVLFESINGNIYYYDAAGKLLNHDSSTFELKDDPDVKMSFIIALPDHSRGLVLEQSEISGKIITKSVQGSEVTDNYKFLAP